MTLQSANFTFIKSVHLLVVNYRASTCHESPPKSDVGHFHEELMKKEAATERRIIRRCLYEADAIKIVGAFLQCSQTDLQVIIRKCLYEADAIKIVKAFLQCSQTDLQVIIRKCLHEADAIKIVGAFLVFTN